MTEEQMPVAEATVADAHNDEQNSYELAFHVLPTVTEGEVGTVFAELKDAITKAGGNITTEEAPQRFDLAYDIVKHIEGKNRKFSSAYFGWVRFVVAGEAIEALTETVEADKRLLRYLLIKLTRLEEEHPFRFHEAINTKQVTTIEDKEVVESEDDSSKAEAEVAAESEEAVDADAVDEALKKSDA